MRWKIQSQLKRKSPRDRQQELVNLLLKNRGLKTSKQKKGLPLPIKGMTGPSALIPDLYRSSDPSSLHDNFIDVNLVFQYPFLQKDV